MLTSSGFFPVNSQLHLQENVPLAPFTTLKIGGPARYFVEARSEDEVVSTVWFAVERGIPIFVLGGGSNVLVSDKGFNGLVIRIGITGIARGSNTVTENTGELTVGAGEDWDNFVFYCVERDMAGVECLSGIPGSVGGTPVQNVGAYGQEVSDTITSVQCFDTKHREIVTLENAECGFTYRTSIFNSSERGRYVVLAVTFRLTNGGPPKIVYKDLVEYFSGRSPSLAEVRDAVLKIRRAKSMVIDMNDPNAKSAGSFFKNPVISWEKYREIDRANNAVPYFVSGEKVKIPAAWLIEKAGFHKGFSHRGVGISTNHTLALINRNGATAAEMLELKEMIQAAVETRFGIVLEPEPVFLGF